MGSPPYYYSPSFGAALIFVVLFLATTVLHLYQMYKSKMWFLSAFCCGGICECERPFFALPLLLFRVCIGEDGYHSMTDMHLLMCSRSGWLHSSVRISKRNRYPQLRYWTFHHPNNASSCGAGLIFRVNIYGAWAYQRGCRWR